MSDHVLAAVMGSLVSAMRHTKQGTMKVLKVALTGFCLAYFTALDVADIINSTFAISMSYGASFFLVSYFGAELLERLVFIIRSYQAASKWK